MDAAEFFQRPGCVGVTGHRMNRLTPAMVTRLEARFRQMFADVGPECALLSCMADGTDWIAARCWPVGRRLETLLPVPVPVWQSIVEDLVDWTAMTEVLEAAPPEVLSAGGAPDYVALAERLVARSDRILAVWDGAPGRPGGTGSVVAAARAAGKAVLHVPLARLEGDKG